MNPHQKNKIDVKSLSPEEQRLFRLYGKLPSKSDHFAKHLKERKYFDSGDYALSKAGKADGVDTGAVGSQHLVPEDIPHLTSPSSAHNTFGPSNHLKHPGIPGIQQGSPVKESSFLNRETSAEEVPNQAQAQPEAQADASGTEQTEPEAKEPAVAGESIPIRG